MADEITRQVAGFVATELGDGWTVDTSDRFAEYRGVYIDGPDAVRLFLAPDWRKPDRLEVSGTYPDGARDIYPTPARHEIGVSRDRGPAVIAREITRRLLPGYVVDLAAVLERLEARNVAAGERETVVAEMLAAYPNGLEAGQAGRLRIYDNRDGGWYGDADLYHDGSRASLELRSLPSGLALEVLRVLAGWDK